MGRVEYKVELVHWKDEPESRLAQLVEHLNLSSAKDGLACGERGSHGNTSFGTKSLRSCWSAKSASTRSGTSIRVQG